MSMEGLANTMPSGSRLQMGRSRSASWSEGEWKELQFVQEALDVMDVMRGALQRERQLKERYRAHLRSLYEAWDRAVGDRLQPLPISVLADEVALEGSIHSSPSTAAVPAKGHYQVSAIWSL